MWISRLWNGIKTGFSQKKIPLVYLYRNNLQNRDFNRGQKKSDIQIKIPYSEAGEEQNLTIQNIEERFSISFITRILFQKRSHLCSVLKKTQRYQRKGFLDYEQRWLGVYFRNEILYQPIPCVQLKQINTQIGWGLFAGRSFKANEFIGEYVGIVRKKGRSDRTNSYCFEYPVAKGESTRYVIDAQNYGNLTRFLNHSSEPNLISSFAIVDQIPHIIFLTKRFIQKGEQLCYNYGNDYWKQRSAPQKMDGS